MGRATARLRGRDPGPTGPVVLGLETGGDHLGVALWRLSEAPDPSGRSWRLLESASSHRGHRHADTILGTVDAALERHELTRSDLGLIAVGRGPGGFTGVRVGMATAGGLALGLDVPVWPVDSLLALAMHGARAGVPVLPLIDARKGEVYGALYRWDEAGQWTCLQPALVGPVDRLLERAHSVSENPLVFGSGALVSGLASPVPAPWHVGSAAHVGALAAAAWEGADRDGDRAPDFDPAYIRASDAEISQERRNSEGLEEGGPRR